MKSLTGPIVKSLVFVVVTVLATTLLALTITNGDTGGGRTYRAVFSDVTSLNTGDDVRMAGVRIGQVRSISIRNRREAVVSFSLPADRALAPTVTASIRYRNLIGQRYVALDQGAGSLTQPLTDGATIPLARTRNALDLTVLFNGFQPLFRALQPAQINKLSAEIIAVFQGEGPTIDNLLAQAGALTNTIADKDAVIGKVVTNLNAVLAAVNGRGDQLSTLIASLRRLVSGLSADRRSLGSAVTGLSGLTSDVADLLDQGRAPLKASIRSLGALSANLAGSSGALNSFLERLPTKLVTIGRTASYGSWLNFYLCSVGGRIPVPAGYGNVATTQYPAPPGVSPYPTIVNTAVNGGAPNPAGLVGVNPKTARCGA
ncbi:phospholipid/cholesterol/gamma-HCH transport system substrate-binding protein [Jatrophihabitans endophyticus]|uniref:Phospholipid/cholesterol/gamma-HCH transport system substrate-binding protein n=1 Tax=Jatrophihabitans endophyticus TaxID=1206085 RepID=A0A1M5ET38_9ACTN|nr:MCE family protein [Jatrophihabitans endophyticus]SHF82320.1 phospholipid/cholesterol/gamma-HCH transport system substrate-binding protein [Jatrophihabitans endophyticus]